MIKQKTKLRIRTGVILLLYVLMCIFCLFGISSAQPVNAGEAGSSNVLKELQNDENFNAEDYPVDETDLGIYVFQIAESSSKKAFYVYTYQPAWSKCKSPARKINFSRSENNEDIVISDLNLVAQSGVFCKYVVKSFQGNEPLRYYNIISISRDWIESYDGEKNLEAEEVYKAYEVGKLFIAEDLNDKVVYSVRDIEVVNVTDYFLGSVRFEDANYFYSSGADVYFLAFSSDKYIQHLLSADVSCYVSRAMQHYDKYRKPDGDWGLLPGGDLKTAHLSSTKTHSTSELGFTEDNYELKEISSSLEFLSQADKWSYTTFDSDEEKKIKSYSWVLMFMASQFSIMPTGGGILNPSGYQYTGYGPREVTLFHLTYETFGKLYDLGVVMDTVNVDGNPEGVVKNDDGLPWWFIVLIIIVSVILLCLLLPIISPVFSVAISALKIVFKALWWLICLPFRAIAALIHKIKGDGGG